MSQRDYPMAVYFAWPSSGFPLFILILPCLWEVLQLHSIVLFAHCRSIRLAPLLLTRLHLWFPILYFGVTRILSHSSLLSSPFADLFPAHLRRKSCLQ